MTPQSAQTSSTNAMAVTAASSAPGTASSVPGTASSVPGTASSAPGTASSAPVSSGSPAIPRVRNNELVRFDLFLALAIAGVFAAFIVVWFAFDFRIPTTDEAGHILNSLDYKDLLRRARPFKLMWWQTFLSVNHFYPPAVYIFNGALKLALGNARWVDQLSVATYSIVLSLSTYFIGKHVSGSRAAAALAAITVNLYPLMANMSRTYMLDFPLTAMIALGLASLLWWQGNFSWKRAVAASLVLAVACLTKQIAAAYLILPGGLSLIRAYRMFKTDRRIAPFLQILAIATVVLCAVAPWISINWQWIHQYSAESAATIKQSGARLTAVSIFIDYLVGLTFSMSILLCTAFAAAIIRLRSDDHCSLIPVYSSAIGGLAMISTLTWTFPLDRYASGVLIATAVVTGMGARRWFTGSGIATKGTVAAVFLLAFWQFLSFCLAPYPIPLPFASLSRIMAVSLREFRGLRVDKITPLPKTVDWKQEWVLTQIKQRDGAAPVFLNILPSDGAFNPHSFELMAREQGLQVRPTTSRVWTIVGDSVEFSTKTAMYYQWYLLKTGFQGNQLKDAATQRNYDHLTDFVKNGGNFDLIGSTGLPDGSTMFLYRQK